MTLPKPVQTGELIANLLPKKNCNAVWLQQEKRLLEQPGSSFTKAGQPNR